MRCVWILMGCTAIMLSAAGQPPRDRITPLFDDHAAAPLLGGWGYSALIEYHGKRVLFDAGPNADVLAKNSKALGIDLGKLDAVVISHDDPDHYGGLDYVYSVNPGVKVYVPESESGAFSTSVMVHLFRFIHGAMPGQHRVDAPAGANYVRVPGNLQIFPGLRLISLPFQGGSRREQAVLMDVPGGVTMLTGCGHPGIVNLVQHSGARVRLATGGFHLMTSSDVDVRRIVQAMKQAGVESVYPAHCTGRFATTELRRVFGARCEMVAVGSVIALPK
jgi:7,8-dihydropterin-6-yl-methyl-4-(beta-D-ribofuranosyl)aminobenzene 5'-phosphate synthase